MTLSHDSLPSYEAQNLVRYAIPSEQAFDDAVWRGDVDQAERVVGELIDTLASNEYEGYSPQLFHARIKQLALPMYRRSLSDVNEYIYENVESDVSSMYGEATALLEELQHEYIVLRTYNPTDPSLPERRGDLAELTIFTLISRGLYGDAEDQYTVLPSSRQDDIGSITTDGRHTGIDFMILDRHIFGAVPVQVKASTFGARATPYESSILVLSAQHIAGGSKRGEQAVLDLQTALIREVEATQTPEDLEHIQASEKRLYNKIARSLGQPAIY